MSKVECFSADCSKCARSAPAKPTWYGEERFVCNPIPKKHTAIRARECNRFVCAYYDEYDILCRNCKAEKD